MANTFFISSIFVLLPPALLFLRIILTVSLLSRESSEIALISLFLFLYGIASLETFSSGNLSSNSVNSLPFLDEVVLYG